MNLLVEAAATGPSDVLVQQGVLGVAVLGLAGALLAVVKFVRSLIVREQARADKAETKVSELYEQMQRDVIPTVTRVTEAMTRSTEASLRMAEVLGSAVAALRDRDRRT